MAKKKKVITTTKKKLEPTASKAAKATSTAAAPASDLIFGRETFKWILIGVGLIVLGMILMSGGSMPSPDVWDEGLIYSWRRLTLAPIVILAGLGVVGYAIFKK